MTRSPTLALLTTTCLAVVVAAVLVPVRHHSGSATVTARSGTPALGVFRGTDRDKVAGFASWLGRPLDVVVDFSARGTWEQISRPTYMLGEWADSGLRPAYGVAMLPEQDGDATMRSGAAGAYDHYFATLARELVTHHQHDAVLRLGWEFNLDSSPWSSPDPELFIAYWRRIVLAMRAVKGQAFVFDWNPNNGDGNRYDAPRYYPGDDVVDVVGVDVYDQAGKVYPYPSTCDAACRQQRQQRAWKEQIYGGARGLRYWRDFAASRGKPLSVPEWALWSRPDGTGGGEDPFFLERMHDFLSDPANGVMYHAYFEADTSTGRHSLQESFEASGLLFRFLWGP